jgi:hypothetical protein
VMNFLNAMNFLRLRMVGLKNITVEYREFYIVSFTVGWPDIFNSGVFVFKPNVETFASLIQFAEEHGSFDGNV